MIARAATYGANRISVTDNAQNLCVLDDVTPYCRATGRVVGKVFDFNRKVDHFAVVRQKAGFAGVNLLSCTLGTGKKAWVIVGPNRRDLNRCIGGCGELGSRSTQSIWLALAHVKVDRDQP